MDRDMIIRLAGKERYRSASAELKRLARAPEYGMGYEPALHPANDATALPHDIADFIWEGEIPSADKIELFFAVYDDLPSYGMLMYAKFAFNAWGPAERSLWWQHVRERLRGPQWRPLAISLWCDFFEFGDPVDEAWRALTEDMEVVILRRVLPYSGPVPWSKKSGLLREVVATAALQDAVFEALLGAAFDTYGQIDEEEAAALLERLPARLDDPRAVDLKARLAEDPRSAEVGRRV